MERKDLIQKSIDEYNAKHREYSAKVERDRLKAIERVANLPRIETKEDAEIAATQYTEAILVDAGTTEEPKAGIAISFQSEIAIHRNEFRARASQELWRVYEDHVLSLDQKRRAQDAEIEWKRQQDEQDAFDKTEEGAVALANSLCQEIYGRYYANGPPACKPARRAAWLEDQIPSGRERFQERISSERWHIFEARIPFVEQAISTVTCGPLSFPPRGELISGHLNLSFTCDGCGERGNDIFVFLHFNGPPGYIYGHQCQNCGEFGSHDIRGARRSGCECDESHLARDKPLFCPTCRSTTLRPAYPP